MPSLVRPSLLHLDDEVDARFDVGMKLSALLREEEEAAAPPWLPPAPEASGARARLSRVPVRWRGGWAGRHGWHTAPSRRHAPPHCSCCWRRRRA